MFTKARDPAQREPATPQATPVVKKAPRSAPSIISADMTIVGALTASGDIQVDGKVEGDIVAESLTVGEKAVVNGEVVAEEVIVRGLVQGSIKAEKVQLCAGARVEGDIVHAALAVETGALFEGNCRHSPDPLGPKPDKPAAESVARMETAPAPAAASGPEKAAGADTETPEETPRAGHQTQTEPSKEQDGSGQRDAQGSPAARFKPDQAGGRTTAEAGNGRTKGAADDLGKISPGRLRAGEDTSAPSGNAKPK